MPPETQKQSIKKPDKQGYYRLGYRTLVYLLLKYCLLAIVLFIGEIMLVATSAGGNNLPPFSELASASGIFETIIRELEGIVPAFIFLALFLGLIIAITSYRSFRYKIESNNLSIVTGIIGRKKISVPFSQIQNVDLEQGFIHRIFGLTNLVIMTSGHADPKHTQVEDNEVVIPSIDLADGQKLHAFLLDQSIGPNQTMKQSIKTELFSS